MKTHNRFGWMIILAAVFSIGTVAAQPGYGQGKGNGRGYGQGYGRGPGFGPDSCHLQLMVNDVAQEIDLTEKQEKKILQLHYDHMAEVKSLRTEYKNDCVGEREARIASREKMDAAIREVLDEGQVNKYEAFMSERRGPHRRYKGTGHHRGHHKRNW